MVKNRINTEGVSRRDAVRGCLIGGAAGDALGYAIEFDTEGAIFSEYGEKGITGYDINRYTGNAIISDDTQMTLFTANDILYGLTQAQINGTGGLPSMYMRRAYTEWYYTQLYSYERYREEKEKSDAEMCWLTDVPELFKRQAPGNTCLNALSAVSNGREAHNNSKGCGGVMRVAPLGCAFPDIKPETLAQEGEELSKITHQHPLGYMPSAMLVHIIHSIIFEMHGAPLKQIVEEAIDFTAAFYEGRPYIDNLSELIRKAVELSENDRDDLTNIHELGEGWVSEETLAIAVYCALRHSDDFSACIIAAVNHKGDSDSTGAVAGNILGAYLGYDAIEAKWKEKLELSDVILEVADDLSTDPIPVSKYQNDKTWEQKYCFARRKS